MIGYHHSPKLFHILLRALLLGDFSQANFQHSAFSGSHHKILVGRGNRARLHSSHWQQKVQSPPEELQT